MFPALQALISSASFSSPEPALPLPGEERTQIWFFIHPLDHRLIEKPYLNEVQIMFLLNWILQNIFLLKPNMYIGNIPLAFPQPPVGQLLLLPSWKAHSAFRTSPLCTWKWNPKPCSFRRQRGSSGNISSVGWKEQEGHQGQDPAPGTPRAVLPHPSAPLNAQIPKPRARLSLQSLS